MDWTKAKSHQLLKKVTRKKILGSNPWNPTSHKVVAKIFFFTAQKHIFSKCLRSVVSLISVLVTQTYRANVEQGKQWAPPVFGAGGELENKSEEKRRVRKEGEVRLSHSGSVGVRLSSLSAKQQRGAEGVPSPPSQQPVLRPTYL